MLVLLPLPILFFPDGKISRPWRWTLWVYAALMAVLVGSLTITDLGAFTDRVVKIDSSGELKQLGTGGERRPGFAVVALLFLGISVSWVVRQVVAYRRSRGDRRQQLKWLLAGGSFAVFGFFIAITIGSSSNGTFSAIGKVGFLGLIALPISIGIGILRYRLYDIDRLISRTLSYALLTGLLVGVFVGLVLLTTRVLPFSSPVGVAASTLAAAALFSPLRNRGYSGSSTAASTAPVTTPKRPSPHSAPACATPSTPRPSSASSPPQPAGSLQPAHVSVWVKP